MTIKDLVPKFGRERDRLPVRRVEYDPFREFQREMNHLFDDFLTGFPLASRWGEREGWMTEFSPKVDVSETDKDIQISADLPGMDEKDIAVELEESALTLRGERKEEREDKGKNWHTREQSYGTFQRVIPLPAEVVGDKAVARFKKGVLTITVPKREGTPARRKSIKIETEA
jgi:HSP20 family protein